MSVPLARPCRRAAHLVSRSLATAAVSPSSPPPHAPHKSPKPVLYTSVILNRSPILTPSPTTFERAFYAYQQRIRRALHNPFPSEFYFKQGSLLEAHYNAEERARERVAWGPKYAREEDVSPEKRAAEQAALDQTEMQEQSDDKLVSRVHPSDAARDYHSLDRKGRRNLYLLVERPSGASSVWEFPRGETQQGELLHQAAHRDFHAQCGNHMDTWIVARKPIGVYKPPALETSPEDITFFFKAHIMAGQVRPQLPLKDFVWVTKQEIEKRVKKDYWQGVKDMLSDH
ncbi:39S mitochondrial ribosomal protein L46-domain-containing protein [Mycena alexandri]|uniref:Large ribosomal subunit protein mL46 n=1 Tax=Mycena alexandri TaxID=1745969 RepID=A0AAD6X8R3_9AGAR|nr:39S mitochondrial ribosomal protein L46-domain-containing protein [Mycena alexandri]